MSVEFRERHRAYGLSVPPEDVSALLAAGWQLGDAVEEIVRHERVFLLPPKEGEPCDA